jgi:alanine dehydrogenase
MPTDPVWISEQDVVDVLDLPRAIVAVEHGFGSEADGRLATMHKTHIGWGDGHTLHAIGAVDETNELVATKTWAHTAGGATPLLIVWSATTGELRAVIEAFSLGQLRTAAVSGVATRRLSVPFASRLAVIGSGKQALPQVAAVAAVRMIQTVTVFSPTPQHRDALADQLAKLDLGCDVQTASGVEAAVAEAHIVTTATRARTPFLHARMLANGTHINAVGAVTPERRELAPDIFERAGVVVADSVETARKLAVELAEVPKIVRLCEVVAAKDGFDRGGDLTVFKAMGVGLADLALGAEVLARAVSAGLGRSLSSPARAVPQLKEI